MSALPPPAPDCAACAARDEQIAAQQELIGELRDAVSAQADQIAALREQVRRLERALSRNSGNSSMPPSSDDLPGKKPPQRKARGGGKRRKPGKQPGAPGAYLAWDRTADSQATLMMSRVGPVSTTGVEPPGAGGAGFELRSAAPNPASRALAVRFSLAVCRLCTAMRTCCR